MLDFPSAPTYGEAFTVGALKWYWNDVRWGFNVPPPNVPLITAINPVEAFDNAGPTMVTVTGENFQADSEINLNGAPYPTTYASDTQLTFSVTPGNMGAGAYLVTVKNGVAVSNEVTFTIIAVPLVVTDFTPDKVRHTDPVFTLTVNGSGFTDQSLIVFDGASPATTFVSDTQLTCSIIPPGLDGVATSTLAVSDGADTSTELTYTWTNARPTLTSQNPAESYCSNDFGGRWCNFSIGGADFIAGCKIVWDGFNDPTDVTTFNSSTSVDVRNWDPNGATTGHVVGTEQYRIDNPIPSGWASSNKLTHTFISIDDAPLSERQRAPAKPSPGRKH